MQVNKIEDYVVMNTELHYTDEELENEYNAFVSLKIIKSLHELGLVSSREKHILIQKVIDQFTPYLSKIVSQIT